MRRAVLPLSIALLGLLVVWSMPTKRPASEEDPPSKVQPTVRIVEAMPVDLALGVTAYGTVTPRTEIDLVAEVSGKVIATAPAFVAGGFFSEGELLLAIDPRDFELAVTRAEASVAEARQNLERERAEAELATEEWRELGQGRAANPLVLRKPQMADALARLKSAKADLALAELALERTRLRAPFDGRLRDRQVDIGSYVTPGEKLAALYATDAAQIRLPLDDRQLRFLGLSLGRDGDRPPAERPSVAITAEFAGRTHEWTGHVLRMEGTIDPKSRFVYAVAEVGDPYAAAESGKPPLAAGMFVTALIDGKLFESVYPLPPAALQRPGEVLVVDDQNVLQHRAVDVLKREPDRIVIGEGLEPGERVVVDPAGRALAGMTVRAEPFEAHPALARAER